jgi:hypothetical protein
MLINLPDGTTKEVDSRDFYEIVRALLSKARGRMYDAEYSSLIVIGKEIMNREHTSLLEDEAAHLKQWQNERVQKRDNTT